MSDLHCLAVNAQCTTLSKHMQVAIDLSCWLLIVVGILPTGNIFLK